MDDTCAVCAESLDWVAYGACGHKDVCSTCVARLRFICDDRRCCICKTVSDVVFVTKALGDYTKTINDFSLLPSEVKEGRVGQFWYHEDTQTFFDDLDHYKMIKAMCRLSCSICDKIEDHLDDGFRRRARFRNIEQLKGHLFHKHRLIMCSLCLEGRKVFICEQKLYTRSQLTQHTNTGDSEVDGTESERSGFTGHPMCEFCRTPFYGDNELYTHMSTEHYTCHLCQRQNPSQYNYYKGYDDLEIHFRRDHLLCEDEGCLAKKFIVFLSEAELKRHNTLEHGGRMSRSKRSAALQIPTSFRYRRGSEQENRRGRGHTFRRDPADTELSLAIQASINTDSAPSSSIQPIVDHGDITDFESLIPPIENLAVTDTPSRYLQAVSQSSRNGTLGESSFPPLPLAPATNQQNSHLDVNSKKTIAAVSQSSRNGTLGESSFPPLPLAPATNQQNSHPDVNFKKTIAAVSQSSRNGTLGESSFPPLPLAPATNKQNSHPDVTSKKTIASVLRSHENKKMHRGSSSSSSAWPAFTQAPTHPTTNPHTWSAVSSGYGLVSSSGQRKSAVETGDTPSLASSRNTSHMTHSSSAPNLSEREHFGPTVTESSLASASAVQTRKPLPPTVDQALNKVENVHTANKSLVEKMRAALGFDEDRFTAFKDISGEYRQGSMDAEMYLSHVDQFGLSHLVLEMARLLPNASRQKELIDAYNLNMACNASRETILSSSVKHGSGSKKGKGKAVESSSSSTLADNVINTVKQLQSSFTRGTEEEVEVLSKDGYRGGKSKVVVGEPTKSTGGQVEPLPHAGSGPTNRNAGGGDGKSKRKKTSKFNRVRLGDGYNETFLDLRNADPDPGSSSGPNESLPVRGVWKNGGGKKLLGMASGGSKN